MVIGISGKIRSGKSRVAKTIIGILEENGKNGVVKRFAQPLYEIISEMYDNDIDTIKKDKPDKHQVVLGYPVIVKYCKLLELVLGIMVT